MMWTDSSCLQENGCLFNGLSPNKIAYLTRVLGMERWTRAKERAAELIARIQPDQPSWENRNSSASYVQHLTTESIPCVVLVYGSLPLKKYLSDGDINFTVFIEDGNLKDYCSAKVSKIPEKEGTDANAEYQIKEVQLIPAEVDQIINQNHLLNRSILLIKAWFYYESHLLGAYHGIFSTYALVTLILYIMHVFNKSLAGPFEVLYHSLEFFSTFDYNFCIRLQGRVLIRSIAVMTPDPPRKDGGALFLSKRFLDTRTFYYIAWPSTPEIKEEFSSKHLNVIEFLCINNLGRSVSRGKFFRIRSAFTFWAKRLAGILDCPLENVMTEFNRSFANTREMNGRVLRPDTHFVHTSGFVSCCHMEKDEELDHPAITYADSSFTIYNPESRLFCREQRKQNPSSVQAIACYHSEHRKQYELIVENGDSVGRCAGGRKEILCSSFTNSMLKVSSSKFKNWTAFITDLKPVIGHVQCQTRSHRYVFQHFCHKVKGDKEEDRFWNTEKTSMPNEALLTRPLTNFSFSTPDWGPCAGSAHHSNHSLSNLKTEKSSTRKQKEKYHQNHCSSGARNNMRWRSHQMVLLWFLVLIGVSEAVGKVHIVGGSAGWNEDVNVTRWAETQKFILGDLMIFHSKGNIGVEDVSEQEFQSCKSIHAMDVYLGAYVELDLSRTGDWYIICANPKYCMEGLKMHIQVQATPLKTEKKKTKNESEIIWKGWFTISIILILSCVLLLICVVYLLYKKLYDPVAPNILVDSVGHMDLVDCGLPRVEVEVDNRPLTRSRARALASTV